jgi:hypothetical protein
MIDLCSETVNAGDITFLSYKYLFLNTSSMDFSFEDRITLIQIGQLFFLWSSPKNWII